MQDETAYRLENRALPRPTDHLVTPDVVHAMLEAQMRRTPDVIAVTVDGRNWTYAELNEAAERIAGALRTRGAGSETLVGVCVDRSFSMLACLIGVMKAGAAYLPLDPDLPAARLAQIVADAQPVLVIGPSNLLPALAAPDQAILPLEDVDAATSLHAFPAQPVDDPEGLAYVMYTSGSTGRPKGVEIRHASVVNLLASLRREPGFDASDVLLAATRMSFDISVADFFLPLSCGGRIVIAGTKATTDPIQLAQLIEQSGATVMQATPATWRALLDTGWQGASSLRIWSGGEAMSSELAIRLLPRCHELWNLYGPTETTVWSAVHRVSTAADLGVPVGRPVNATRLYLLDETFRPVPAGAIGELCIAGAGVARGYRSQPELTASRFITLEGESNRVYRTGDLARFDGDGLLHCLGRIDDQVKIRGHRVEMGEVEAVIGLHPATAWCAVRCWPDMIGENGLFAYVVFREGESKSTESLDQYLKDRLPAYMMPQRIFSMDALPITPNGKIDRGALPRPAEMPGQVIDRSLANVELDATQEMLASIWRELLGPVAIGPNDDFFDLGGYSLLTVRLMLAIEEVFGRRLSMAELFSASGLAALARLIDGNDRAADQHHLLPLQPRGSKPPLYWLDGGPLIRTVARAMSEDQPVFGLNLSSEDEMTLTATGFDVPYLASRLVNDLHVAQPDGPYYLGGWCRWGIVAYEVARQLREQGADVRLLMLLDADNPAIRQSVLTLSRTVLRDVRRRVFRHAEQNLSPLFGQLVENAVRRFRPMAFDGDVALLRPQGMTSDVPFDGGWRDLIGGDLTIYRTPGTHVSMVRPPHSPLLASAMMSALSRAQS